MVDQEADTRKKKTEICLGYGKTDINHTSHEEKFKVPPATITLPAHAQALHQAA